MNDKTSNGYSRYYWYKEHVVCVKCGQADARHGRTLCYECAEKSKNRICKPMTEEQKERAKTNKAEKQNHRIEQGLCPNCGKRPPATNGKYCETCRAYYRRRKEAENRKKGIMPRFMFDGTNLCARCGKEKPLNGYRVCQKCYDIQSKCLDLTPTHNGGKVGGKFAEENDLFFNQKQRKS